MGGRPWVPDAEQAEALCAEIALGASVAEACRLTGQPYVATIRLIQRGAKARLGRGRQLYLLVIGAQAAWEKKARNMLIKAAAGGAPKAIDTILQRLQLARAETQPEEKAPAERHDFLAWRLSQIRRWIPGETGIARTKLLDEERRVMREIWDLESASEKKGGDTRPEDMTSEERDEHNRADAASCELSDLERYVEAWCQLQGLEIVVESGAPILRRVALRLAE